MKISIRKPNSHQKGMKTSRGCREFTTDDSFPKLLQCLSNKELRECKCFQSRPCSPMFFPLRAPASNQLTNNPAEPHALPSNRMWTGKDWDCWSVSSQDVAEQCSHAALKHFIISSHAGLYSRLGINSRSVMNANLEKTASCLELGQNLMSIHLEH